MKNKVLLSSALMLAAGVSFFSIEFNSENSNGYVPRESNLNVRPGIEERMNGGREIFERLRATPNGVIDRQLIAETKNKANRKSAKRASLGLEWNFMGPTNRGGRTRALIVDNENNQRLYTGGVAGGLFISENKGASWEVYDDQLENLMVSTIAQGPNGTLYVGTGGDFGGSGDEIPGGGVYKSTDRGQTFVRLQSTDPATSGLHWETINRIEVNPTNDDEVLAGTRLGLYYSNDGGLTWNQTIYVDPNCTIFGGGRIDDVEWTKGGVVYIGYNGGVYRSSNPSDACSYESITSGIPSSSSRIDITFCKSDENIVYAMQVNGSGQLAGMYQSTDGAVNWTDFSPAPPSSVIDSTFNLFGDNGQGIYDLAIEVAPDDCDMIYVGGVQTYRINGSWTRIAENFAPEASGFYVHSDKHYFVFDESSNSNTMFICSDGGIGYTDNALADQPLFYTINRNYGTTQFYGIAASADGRVIGGTQDNGTWLIDPSLPGESSTNGIFVRGGDGFDTDISDLFPFAYATTQFGTIGRYDGVTNSAQEFGIPGPGPFWSIIKLWENQDDPTSKDSVVFNNDTTTVIVAQGNGAARAFSGTLAPTQKSASIVLGSIQFTNITAGVTQILRDEAANGILVDVSSSDSVGVYNYTTGEFEFTLPQVPGDKSDINGSYTATFNLGDTLVLRSNTQRSEFDYVLPIALAVGDSIVVRDPIQALFASAHNNGTHVTREALRDNVGRQDWIRLPGNEIASCFEFSADGDHLYVGDSRSGSVYRYSGLNDLYSTGDLGAVTRTVILGGGFSSVTGLSLHPTDNEKLLVTFAGYGHSEHIIELQNAQSANGTATQSIKEGDLGGMPVFDAEYHVLDPSIVIIGTDFGVWSTEDINATNVAWSSENATLSNTPVFDIIQQKLPWGESTNHEVFYAGTHGRGIWSTSSLINSTNDEFDSFDNKVDLGLAMYPNPVNGEGRVNFNLTEQSSVDIQVFDLNGRVVKQFLNQNFEAGKNTFAFNTSSLAGGTYLLSIKTNTEYSTSKFVVVK